MPQTTNVLLEVPAHGSFVDTWDQPLNANAQAIDGIFGSVTSIAVSGSTTLSTTQLYASILRFTGANNATVTVNVSALKRSWIIDNKTTGTGVVVISGGAGNVCGAPPGNCQLYWDGSNVDYINMQQVGDIKVFASTATPSWISACSVAPYLLLDGSAFSQVTFPVLAAILGTTTLGDFQNRAMFMAGGGRLTSAGSGINGTTLFAAGGDQATAILQANFPSVNFVVTGSAGIFGGNTAISFAAGGAGSGVAGPVGITGTAASGGSGTAFKKVPPAVIAGIAFIRAG